MLIALVSAKGSPGVTVSTLALASAWHRPALVAECDPAGGSIAAGMLRGQVEVEGRGLFRVASAARRGEDVLAELGRNVFALDDERRLLWLPGLGDPARAPLVAEVLERVGATFRELDGVAGVDVLADCGRLSATTSPLPILRAAALTLLVVRPTVASTTLAAAWVAQLTRELPASRLGVLAVGPGEYRAAEVSAALRLPVRATLPDDPTAAAAFAAGGVVPRPTAVLLRAAADAGGRLREAVESATLSWPPPPPPSSVDSPPAGDRAEARR